VSDGSTARNGPNFATFTHRTLTCVTPELPTLSTMGKTLDGATATMKKVSDPCPSCERWRDRGLTAMRLSSRNARGMGAVEHKKCKEQTEAVMACGRPWVAMGRGRVSSRGQDPRAMCDFRTMRLFFFCQPPLT
jgi:hypothetical protein